MKLWFVLILSTAGIVAEGEVVHLRQSCERLLIDRGWINKPTEAQIMPLDGSTVRVSSDSVEVSLGDEAPVSFLRTNRNILDLTTIDAHFPKSFLNPKNLRGKKVLDLACGEGRAVEDLRRAGVNAFGLDVYLSPYMKTKPYFIRASAHHTGLPDGRFDVIYSSQGPFTYLSEQNEIVTLMLNEAHRLLKTGGVLRISPIHVETTDLKKFGGRPEIDLKGTAFENLPPGLRLKSWPDQLWFIAHDPNQSSLSAHYWLEIERID